MPGKLKIAVSGYITQYPLGGVAWDYIQYLLGLKKLGHDVYYLEDTNQWPYNPISKGISQDYKYNVEYLRHLMERFDLGDRWAYKFPWQSQWFGLGDNQRKDVIKSADLVLNISGSLANAERYDFCGKLVYLDSDPTFTQLKILKGQRDFVRFVSAHDKHFSFGETLPGELPETEFEWIPTRQPVVLEEWPITRTQRDAYTTVMNWTSYKPIEYLGQRFGQKDVEFRKFLDLPGKVNGVRLELAINSGKTQRAPFSLLKHKGWQLVDPNLVCPDLDSYRNFILNSRAEWTVTKNGYVAGQSGWFSCRSACYLAAGRPVIVQDTGFSNVLPTGKGIITFGSLEEAAEGIAEVESRYDLHSDAARSLAETWFSSDVVLENLINLSLT